ncbi:MAG: carbonic anhydrase [Planctomycetes bacterium]|nr:carbonic anhydrase [Planctomycetota bacterium]
MKTIEDLLNGYRGFRRGVYGQQVDLYARLARGQDPDIMLIGCADSRADPSDIFDTAPGELFTVRNVANLVPPYQPDGSLHGVSAALEFAVGNLGVHHIVVMGHGQCGGVKACLHPERQRQAGEFVGPWVSQLDEVRDRVLAEQPSDPQLALELAGVHHSLKNLMTFPFVREAIAAGRLELHGAWFAISSGELSWLDSQEDCFQLVSH